MDARQSAPRRLHVYRVVCGLIDLAMSLLVRRSEQVVRLPEGALLVAPNHISVIDPLLVAGYLQRCGRTPRFVTTSGVFAHPVAGPVLRYFDHLPLSRTSREPQRLEAEVEQVVAALGRGECVVMYPEGRVTDRDDVLPTSTRPGLARLAALSGAPVVPLAQWGSHEAVGRRRRFLRRLPPRRPIAYFALGRPRIVGAGDGPRTWVAATRGLMDEVTALVVGLQEQARRDHRSGAR